MKIIYQTETGICIVHPTGELSIEQVFEKDVPSEYKHTACIVDDEYIPSDRTFRDAWQFDGVDLVNKTCISENIDGVFCSPSFVLRNNACSYRERRYVQGN